MAARARSRAVRWGTAASLIGVAVLLLGFAAHSDNPDALWHIVHGQCVPDQLAHGDPKPCAEVELRNGVERGYAVLKDRNGASQFLLIPTRRITGIEDPVLLAPDAVNYFAAAWHARRLVENALGRTMPIDSLSLAVNSKLARTQNQLHIHVDCVRAEVRRALGAARASIGEHWAPLSAGIDGHPYLAMRVLGATLDGHNPFKLLADGVPGAAADMVQRTLAVVGMQFDQAGPGFVILEDRTDLLGGDFAAGARLQDRACALAHGGPGRA